MAARPISRPPVTRRAVSWGAMGLRHVVVHGHFYQPPRESPWLEIVEEQPSAAPFHDWNARVSAECYAPNAGARILDAKGRVDRLVNNYASISFDAGPTLMAWLEREDPTTHAALIEADRTSVRTRGHGVAMAQVHGHLILPLCNERDRRTQVRWGVRDFEWRYGRKPRGMWLAETAVDVESLEAMAAEGIALTVLAPHQCARVRPIGHPAWVDVGGGRVDPRRAYDVALPSGKHIAVFFYDGPLSRAVAFEHVLNDGKTFADRILGTFHPSAREPQIVHLATDGESYGHIITSARWRSRSLSRTSRRAKGARRSPATRSTSPRIRRPGRPRSFRARAGAARTAWSAGGATAAARRARPTDGARPGARRCAARSTS